MQTGIVGGGRRLVLHRPQRTATGTTSTRAPLSTVTTLDGDWPSPYRRPCATSQPASAESCPGTAACAAEYPNAHAYPAITTKKIKR